MKHLLLSILLFSKLLSVQAQLPTKTVTIFKNGHALLNKTGQVTLNKGQYISRDLPNALFGTFWISANSGDLLSVFSARDSVETRSNIQMTRINMGEILRINKEKKVMIYVDSRTEPTQQLLEGWFERDIIYKDEYKQMYGAFLFRTIDGRFLVIESSNIHQLEFKESPVLDYMVKKASQRLELNFLPKAKPQQDISMLYLLDSLGWTPVYRLDLLDKNKGRLALRAEIANDAEDLGDAELRLAVGIPNFALGRQKSLLVDFANYMMRYSTGNNAGYMSNTASQMLNPYRGNIFNIDPEEDEPVKTEGSQAEDFYFYTLRPGNFPKHSRYQLPVLETEVIPVHFYECIIQPLPQISPNYYQQNNIPKPDDNPSVAHYIAFKNTGSQPWTTGVVNILSQSGENLQPVSQDILPYTPAGGSCKVLIAQTPEINVSYAEGVKERKENAVAYFNHSYDLITVEGQIVVFNHKNEPATIKVRRTLEGKPLSSGQTWTLDQKQASLRVNSTYELQWELELKAGEERKWSYSYEVLVDL